MNAETVFFITGTVFFLTATIASVGIIVVSILLYKKFHILGKKLDTTAQTAQKMMQRLQNQPLPKITQLILPFLAQLPLVRSLLRKRRS